MNRLRKTRARAGTLILVIGTTFTVVFGTQTAAATYDALQQCVASKAAQNGFSGVIDVTRNDHPLVSIARGKLAGDESSAITPDTRFNLGSASKMFTAVAIGQLIDAGKLHLDDHVGAFVDGLQPETRAVTIRQLLTHSSGLGDFFKPENMAVMLRARTASDLLPLIAREKPAFPPGSRFAYSNSGFVLLGIVLERVSGLSYGDYLAQHILAPAGMTRTGLDPKPLKTLAVGMTAMGREATPGVAPTLSPAPGATEGYGSPAGGMFSTVGDLQRFARALLDHKLTSASTAAALATPQIVSAPATADRPERQYGYGFGVGIDNGHRWFGHNGGTPGTNTEFAVFPDDRLTVSVLANRDPPMATAMFAYVKRLLFDPSLVANCVAPSEKHVQ